MARHARCASADHQVVCLAHCSLIVHVSLATAHTACRCTDERPHVGEDILPQLRTLAAWAQHINEPPSWYECPITSVSCLPQNLTDVLLSSFCDSPLHLTQASRDCGFCTELTVLHDAQHQKEDLSPTVAWTFFITVLRNTVTCMCTFSRQPAVSTRQSRPCAG